MTDARPTLLSILQRADPGSPEQLLARVLPILVSDLGVSAGHVYRLTRGGMIVWGSSDPTLVGIFTPHDPASAFQQAIDTLTALTATDQNVTIFPLLADARVFALLVLEWQTPPDLATTEPLAAIIAIALRSKQLAQILERQNAITEKLNSTVTLADVAGAIASSILQHGQLVSINRFERDGGGALKGVTVVASASIKQTFAQELPLSVGLSYLNMVFNTLQTEGELLISDLQADDRLDAEGKRWLADNRIRATYNLPLFLHNRLFAFVSIIDRQNAMGLSLEERNLYRNAIGQATSIIERRRLLEESEQRAIQMEQIAEFSQSVQSSLQIPDILDAALRYSQDIVSHEYMAVLLYDRADNTLKRSAFVSDQQRSIDLPGNPVTAEQDSIAWHVWQNREPLRISTLKTDWEWTHPEAGRLSNLVVVPLIAGSLDLGVLEVGTGREIPYTTTDLAALAQMANQIAIAIGNAETYEQSQKMARNKALSNEIAARLQRQADLNELLQTTAEELGRAVGAKRIRIRIGANFQKTRE